MIDAPFCVQVELSEGCNLFCQFCGLRGIRQGPMKNVKLARNYWDGSVSAVTHDVDAEISPTASVL